VVIEGVKSLYLKEYMYLKIYTGVLYGYKYGITIAFSAGGLFTNRESISYY
jgi:hypothetical protein